MMSTIEPSRWEQRGYSDIIEASRIADGVQVHFANGDTVTVSSGILGVGTQDYSVQADPDDPTSVCVRTEAGMRTVDWSAIRAASDPGFAGELRARDAEESRRVARRLRALREDRGVPQAVLAKLVDMSAPQLAKLEKGESDMRLSTVQSLLRALDASFADISDPQAPERSVIVMSRLAKQAGVPDAVVKAIAAQVSRSQFAAALGRAFRWSAEELDAGQLPAPVLVPAPVFKASSPQPEDSPLLPLAHTVAAICASGYNCPIIKVPADPQEMRRQLLGGGEGPVTLEMLLAWAWKNGIIVIPMIGPSGFSAAAWSIEGRPIVVLKESRSLVAFWLFDLAHELGHIARGHLAAGGVVDLTSPTDPDTQDPQEREATVYALELLLPGHEALIAEIRRRSVGDPRKQFKFAVEKVAAAAKLSPAVLGVAAAYQLTDIARPLDRWGSATNIGKPDGSGREIAESYFRANMPLSGLSDIDAGLIRAVVLSS
jgi:transcriptional regulator with XRE-family HTH domain